MRWTKTLGLLFLAASAVYSYQLVGGSEAGDASMASRATALPATDSARLAADEPGPADLSAGPVMLAPPAPPTEVKLLEQAEADPFAESAEPATQPAEAGRSVSESEVKMSDGGTVEIHVNEAPLLEVLRMLSLQSQRNIVASKEVRGTVTANLYDVTVREALDAILHANGYGYREQGSFIYVYTQKELQEIEKANRKAKTEVFTLHYANAANAANLIKPVLSADAKVALTTPAGTGIETSQSDAGGDDHASADTLVVTDYEENLARAREILQEIDQRPQQVLVEAVIMRATLTEENAFGVDFNVLAGVDFAQINHSRGQITGAELPEGDGVITADETTSAGTGNNFTRGVEGGLKVGFVSNDVSAFLAALEAVTDTTVMANPKVLTLNKQRAEVHVGRNFGYLTTTVTESATVQTVEFLETGTKLVMRPYIGREGFIRLEIHPEDSDGGIDSRGLPFESTTEVTTNVMVKDGRTIVIGGLFRDANTVSESQIPILGNLPLVGSLFGVQRDNTQREEVIILLTPHIVEDPQDIAAASEAALADAEKLRVGVRKGMLPWGRERLAEAAYDNALKELAKRKPNRGMALWHLNGAINLNPKFVEAIHLREELTGKEMAGVDNSSIRGFVRRQILAEQMLEQDKAPAGPAAGAPTTQPVAEVPSTQPTAGVPSTQPVAKAPATQPTAKVPATQPTAAVPSTQPMAKAKAPTSQPAVSKGPAGNPSKVVFVPESKPAKVAEAKNAPTSQPAQAKTKAAPKDSRFTVTEVSVEEIPSGRSDNK